MGVGVVVAARRVDAGLHDGGDAALGLVFLLFQARVDRGAVFGARTRRIVGQGGYRGHRGKQNCGGYETHAAVNIRRWGKTIAAGGALVPADAAARLRRLYGQ